MDESRAEVAARVFEHWKQVMKKPRACLDAKRMRLICARLADGYSEDDLRLAAYGISKSRWHMGENELRKKYCNIELIYRDADHVDQYIELGEQAVEREQRRIQVERERSVESIQKSTTGPIYQKQRESLLKIVGKA